MIDGVQVYDGDGEDGKDRERLEHVTRLYNDSMHRLMAAQAKHEVDMEVLKERLRLSLVQLSTRHRRQWQWFLAFSIIITTAVVSTAAYMYHHQERPWPPAPPSPTTTTSG